MVRKPTKGAAPPQKAAKADRTGADALATLAEIANDPNAAAAARTAAARTILEIQGQLGKHQAAPDAGTARVPLSQATRGELEEELSRLRLHLAAQTREKT